MNILKKKLKILMSMVLSVALLLSVSACQSPENNTGNDGAVTLAATEVISSTTATTQNATATAVVTQEPTQATTVEPTAEPTQEPTKVPTKAPTQEPTKAPTQAPTETHTPVVTSTPTEEPQPTADPAIYPDDFGISYGNNAYRTDRKVLIWTESRHIVEIPESLPSNWVADFIDEKNEQLFIRSTNLDTGVSQYFALVNGTFYKLSFGKVVDYTLRTPNKYAWIEEGGTVYSIGIRSKWFNEVYVESDQPIKGIGFDEGGNLILAIDYMETVKVIKENVLRDIKIIT